MNVRARYQEWANGFSTEWVRAISWPQGWTAIALSFALLLVLADSIPAARAFFAVRLGPALVLLVLSFGTLLLTQRLDARGAFGTGQRAAVALGVSFLLQLFSSGLVTLSAPPGSFAMAVFPIIAAWHDLGMFRSSPRHPFATISHAAAMAVAATLAPDAAHLAILGAVALLGLGGGTLLGMITSWGAASDARLQAHHAALAAQSLAVFAGEIEDAEATLAEVDAGEREVRERLAQARRACAALEGASLPGNGTARHALARVCGALERLDELLIPPAPVSLGDLASPVAVAVLPVVRAAVADANRRWPELQWSCAADGPAADPLFAELPGGPEALRGMLDPLLANAAEGDGAFGASRVEVLIRRAGEDVELELRDDGPGFAGPLLRTPIALLRTTKRGGSGLGLYTAERLARSVGGSLARSNRSEGGARVALHLPGAPRQSARRDAR